MPRLKRATREAASRTADSTVSDAHAGQSAVAAATQPMLTPTSYNPRKRTRGLSFDEDGDDDQPVRSTRCPKGSKGRRDKMMDGKAGKDVQRDMKAIKEKWRENCFQGRELLQSRLFDRSDLKNLKELSWPPGWTQNKEDALIAQWDHTQEKTIIEAVEVAQEYLKSLWKMTLHLFRCTPLAVMNPRLGLCYEGDSAILWSQRF